jgi:hypothetical protein
MSGAGSSEQTSRADVGGTLDEAATMSPTDTPK